MIHLSIMKNWLNFHVVVCNGVKIIHVYMLTIFSLSQCNKEKLSFILSDSQHSNISLLCLTKLIFGLLWYTTKKREQEYMRSRRKGFRLHSKPIHIMKYLQRGKYWEKRTVLPGSPGKVGSVGDKLRRETLETCGMWCKKTTGDKGVFNELFWILFMVFDQPENLNYFEITFGC